MPTTGLFYLPASSTDQTPTTTLLTNIQTAYTLTPLPPWSLHHRLFRETPPQPTSPSLSTNSSPTNNNNNNNTNTIRYLQLLTLSHHTPKTHVAITTTTVPTSSQTRTGTPASSPNLSTTETNTNNNSSPADPATLISIPAGPTTEEFIHLLLTKFGPVWQQRQVLSVTSGQAFEVGDFRVRIGEVRQGYGAGAQMGRGAVCEIGWVGEDDGGEEEEDGEEWGVGSTGGGEAVVRAFWEGVGVRGAREVFLGKGVGGGEDGDGEGVRGWIEILRVRG